MLLRQTKTKGKGTDEENEAMPKNEKRMEEKKPERSGNFVVRNWHIRVKKAIIDFSYTRHLSFQIMVDIGFWYAELILIINC